MELLAQGYYHLEVGPALEQQRTDARHYYRKSENPILTYELSPDYRFEAGPKSIYINSEGLRGRISTTANAARIGLCGDSVVFSTGHGDNTTITSLLGKSLESICHRIEALNFGVPGYAIREIHETQRSRTQSIDIDAAIYVMNLNDFSWRETVFEGADNGLYRMYQPPWLKSPWLLRKIAYRWVKYGSLSSTSRPSPRWYRWMFNGTKKITLDEVKGMKSIADQNEFQLAVFLLPAGVAYEEGAYLLSDIHSSIRAALTELGIIVVDGQEIFSENPSLYFDQTDHLTIAGNGIAAQALSRLIRSKFPNLADQVACKI